MKYFIDTEFIEGPQDKTFFGFKYGQTKPTIDLISIGIVSEDGREYYAISKDFNLKQAWKNEWVRENVLKPIFKELAHEDAMSYFPVISKITKGEYFESRELPEFTFKNLKMLINECGKTNDKIAKEIIEFCTDHQCASLAGNNDYNSNPEFWAYYSDYDWVVFCQLFGTMMDLPTGFPKYCMDLMQLMRDRAPMSFMFATELHERARMMENGTYPKDPQGYTKWVKTLPDYPKQENEHDALADAKWNKELFNFLIRL